MRVGVKEVMMGALLRPAHASLAAVLLAQSLWAADVIVGASAASGGAVLLKRIDFSTEATIIGVRFTSNDRNTVFPRVVVAASGFETLAGMRVLAEARDVSAGG